MVTKAFSRHSIQISRRTNEEVILGNELESKDFVGIEESWEEVQPTEMNSAGLTMKMQASSFVLLRSRKYSSRILKKPSNIWLRICRVTT